MLLAWRTGVGNVADLFAAGGRESQKRPLALSPERRKRVASRATGQAMSWLGGSPKRQGSKAKTGPGSSAKGLWSTSTTRYDGQRATCWCRFFAKGRKKG